MRSYKIAAVVLCAGKGARADLGYNKTLHTIGANSVAAMSANKFAHLDQVVVVCAANELEQMRATITLPNATFVAGGETRTESVRNALCAIESADVVIIHDGTRPYVNKRTIDECVQSAITHKSGVAAVKSTNALKLKTENGCAALDRERVYVVQTPQAFDFDALKAAYDAAPGSYADDSEVFELAGHTCHLVEGSYDNVKLTTPSDFMGLNGAYRVGFGYDVHQFAEGKKLVLCGRTFDYPRGLVGHSDADAPVHALMDALLSAAGLPDIGVLFPDTDMSFKNADSMKLLEKVMARLNEFEVVNASLCIMAQAPKMSPHVMEMRTNLAAAMGIDVSRVNISATTTEHLGIVGEGKGLAASADVLIRKI